MTQSPVLKSGFLSVEIGTLPHPICLAAIVPIGMIASWFPSIIALGARPEYINSSIIADEELDPIRLGMTNILLAVILPFCGCPACTTLEVSTLTPPQKLMGASKYRISPVAFPAMITVDLVFSSTLNYPKSVDRTAHF